jgi:S-adenosylmethionine hydrolase
MDKQRNIVALITDFGLSDHFVGAMKLSILNSCSQDIEFIDVSHELEPGNIYGAAYFIDSIFDYLPKGSVVLPIVDPGVGSEREIILCDVEEKYFIGPDNGIMTPLFNASKGIFKVKKDVFGSTSNTFHGRDIFAPLAGELINAYAGSSTDFDNFLEKHCHVEDYYEKVTFLPDYRPEMSDWLISGKIIHIDRYGNAISNIHTTDLNSKTDLTIILKQNDFEVLKNTFSDVDIDEDLAYIGSTGYIEFARRDGNFALSNNISLYDNVNIVF